ncbi:SPFH domain-containing protein [Prosthecobacter fluviatilis]|uniref:SPFH domain-containing protein n=1 Tax=Prosthecobacter fluviatilis TaxID=445931 RepID=A0ABW0KMP5_9BACT
MKERNAFAIPGLLVIFAALGLVAFYIYRFPEHIPLLMLPAAILGFLLLKGFVIVSPNEAVVLTFFGQYSGSLVQNGFWWINPFASRQKISLKIANFQSEQLKVNDAHGNPIEIAAVIVWRVVDSAKATFAVENCNRFVHLQGETALRHLSNLFPYEPHAPGEIALRSHPAEVANQLRAELAERTSIAGIEVLEAQLSHLAYSPEIAQAMLRRQQAQAVLAARQIIVDGAIGMVEMALRKLETDGIVQLDTASKSTMVNNLLVTLVSENHIQPVLATTQMKA